MINLIKCKTIYETSKKLAKKQNLNNKSFLIIIENPKENKIDKSKYYFTNTINTFIDNNKLDKHWNKNNDGWYLSYSRRLMRKINGICILNRAANILIKNKTSRRCIISTNIDIDLINGYCPALSLVQFKIKDDKLEMYTYWRSQEANIAFDLNTLCMFSYQRKMLNILKKYYKNIEIGKYVSYVNDMQFVNLENYPNEEKEMQFKFYCSIIDKKGEKAYDKNYEK